MLKLLQGDPNARKLKLYHPIVSDINLLEEEIAPPLLRRASRPHG
jgi:preprotein translocase subunit SecA